MKLMLGGIALLLAFGCPARAQRLGNKSAQQFPTGNDPGRNPWIAILGTAATVDAAPPPAAPAGATVSVAELKIPPAVRKEFEAFQEKFNAGKVAAAAKHLEKAIQIYPQLAASHHNLGLCYARLGDFDKAAGEFQTAASLDPRKAKSLTNLATVYFLQGHYVDGETAARRALDMDPVNPAGRYWLGRILAAQGRNGDEVLQLLRESRAQFPEARLVLVNVLLGRKDVDGAVAELREYLQRPNAPGKDKVACMIERLTQPSGSSTCAMN